MQKVATYLEISTKYPEVSTFLFDMDGTLMFTERLHAMAINSILVNNEENPFDIDVLESICIGLNDEVVFHKLQKDQLLKDLSLEQFIADKKVIFFKLLKDIRPAEIFKPAVKKLLKDIKKSNSQLALVTSSERETTYQLLDFLKLKDLFDIIITREDTELNKTPTLPLTSTLLKIRPTRPKELSYF
jgi:beta-phosphoglucomutase